MAKSYRYVCSLAWVVALGALVWAQEEPAAPEQPQLGRRVVIMENLPAEGRDIRVGGADTFHLASTAQMLARVEVGRVGEAGDGGETQEEGKVVVLSPRAGQAYSMRIVFVADPEIGGKFVTADEMRQYVEKAAADYTDVAVERAVRSKAIKYNGRPGCYATFTDKRLVEVAQPQPNDFRYVAVGIVRLSEASVLQFQLFTNDLASRDFFDPLEYALRLVKPAASTRPTK